MNKEPVIPNASDIRPSSYAVSSRPLMFALFALLLSLPYLGAFKSLATLALHDDLHSYVFLVPFIAIYLLYIMRDQLPKSYSSAVIWTIFLLTGGVVCLVVASKWRAFWLSATMLSFISFLAAGGFAFLGRRWMKAAVFPFTFLLFITPLPDPVVQWLEDASKFGSADCASFFLHLTGTPLLRDGTIFQLPGIVLEVAQECSGIRSSLVLLIASILASYIFLRRPTNRLLLVLVAIPLGILRNGFRITVIALLCINFGPQMIHSVIHKRGGPAFFVLSLFPLAGFLWMLKRNEDRASAQKKGRQPSTSDQSEILTNH